MSASTDKNHPNGGRSGFATIVDVATLALSYLLSGGSNFVCTFAISRTLGASALGIYSFAVSASRVVFSATDLGLAIHLSRRYARSDHESSELFKLFLAFRTIIIAPVALLTTILAPRDAAPSILTVVFISLGQGIVSLQSLFEAILLALNASRTVAALTTTVSSVLVVGCGGWALAHGTLTQFATVYFASLAIGFSWYVHVTKKRTGQPGGYSWRPRRFIRELRDAAPIGFSQFIAVATLKTPVLVLSRFRSTKEMGCYAAAEVMVIGSAIIQNAISSIVYPRLSRTYRVAPHSFRRLLWRSNAALLVLGCATVITVTLLQRQFDHLFFGAQGNEALRSVLAISAWSIPLLFLCHHHLFVFAAVGRQNTSTVLMVAVFVTLLISELLLVPPYGAVGAAMGLLIARGVWLFAIAVCYFRYRFGDGVS